MVVTKIAMIAKIKKGGYFSKGCRASPKFLDRSDALLPREMAKPPPKRNIKPQGILLAKYFQFINASACRLGLLDPKIRKI